MSPNGGSIVYSSHWIDKIQMAQIFGFSAKSNFKRKLIGSYVVKSGIELNCPLCLCFTKGEVSADHRGFGPEQGPAPGLGKTPHGTGPSGGSHGGRGGRGYEGLVAPKSYDSLFNPTLFGSGGGNSDGSQGGRGGGHVVFDVSNMLRLEGRLRANGQNSGESGGGAGGSIVIRTFYFDGEGAAEVDGGAGSSGNGRPYGGGGGGGRIAVYHESTSTFIGFLQAYGGASPSEKGGAGTVYVENRSNRTAPRRLLKVDNGARAGLPSRVMEVAEVTLTGNPSGSPYYALTYTSPSGIVLSTTGRPYCSRTSNDGRVCLSDNSDIGNLLSLGSFYYTTHASPVITYRLPLAMFLEHVLIYPTCLSGHYTPYLARFYSNGAQVAGSEKWIDPTDCIASQPEKLVVRRAVDKVSYSSLN